MNDIIKKENNELSHFTKDELSLIKSQICRPKNREASDQELKYFVNVSKVSGLNPLMKQVYAIFRYSKADKNEIMSIQTSIDGYRLIAQRSGVYAGSDEPIFEYSEQDTRKVRPIKATVTVYKIVQGVRCPFTASAYWDEYYPTFNAIMWDKMPKTMLGKCSESLALRKAFPQELSALRTEEEMGKAHDDYEHVQEVLNKPKINYKTQEEQIEFIRQYLKHSTKDLDAKTKIAFMKSKLDIDDFNELKKLDNKELQEIIIELENEGKLND